MPNCAREGVSDIELCRGEGQGCQTVPGRGPAAPKHTREVSAALNHAREGVSSAKPRRRGGQEC